ncbi:MAG: ASCH domain-containing protein [Patescibacteria group bacterium]|nr:ASCH domain-containing protein [Patescibacteria group bacterium]
MRHPLQALLIAPDPLMREAVEDGRKRITLREGHRDYRPGPVMLCCQIEPWCVMADIIEVRHCRLCDLTREELEADGFIDQWQMLKQMHRFYPDLDWDSPVTIVRWENVRGKLVDERQAK